MKSINLGIIGTGWITEAFLTAVKKVNDLNIASFNLTCIYSRTKEKAEDFAKKISPIFGENEYNIFTDLEKMAKSDKLDAVYIASPNAFHYEQSRLFLKNSKHVICEKPIATSGDMARELFSLASENNAIFMEAIMALHMPQWQLLSDTLPKLGNISQVHFSYCQLSSKYPALMRGELPNIFNPQMKTGCIMDIGIYCLYPTLALFSSPNLIKSSAKLLENGIDICGSSILTYKNEKLDGIVDLSYSKIGDGYANSQIIGDKGTITIDKLSHLDGIRYYNENKEVTLLHKNGKDVLPMQFEAESFYKYITDYTAHEEQYNRLSKLACDVSEVLSLMRHESGVCF